MRTSLTSSSLSLSYVKKKTSGYAKIMRKISRERKEKKRERRDKQVIKLLHINLNILYEALKE